MGVDCAAALAEDVVVVEDGGVDGGQGGEYGAACGYSCFLGAPGKGSGSGHPAAARGVSGPVNCRKPWAGRGRELCAWKEAAVNEMFVK